jgi:hypothetical protein
MGPTRARPVTREHVTTAFCPFQHGGAVSCASLDLAVAINASVREDDVWFDEPDDLDRLASVLAAVAELMDPVESAAQLLFRVTRAQVLR